MDPDPKEMHGTAEETALALASIKEDLAAIKAMMPQVATKADVSDAKASIIMWVVSAILLAQLLPPLLKKFGLG
ncbi:MAG: hypothetical protein ACXU8N_06605 [Telluria sp.]